MRRVNIILLLMVFFQTVQSQDFKWNSALDTVPQTGFYSIPLGVEWLAQLKADVGDIRIKNEKNEAVPFIIKEHTTNRQNKLVGFTILQNKTDSASTILELDAGTWKGGDHLYLVIGNNAVERDASLSGGNDRKQWFVIHERLRLSNDGNNLDDRFVQWLHFPFVRYRYLKLTIKNKGSDALPVLQAGYIDDTTANKSLEVTPLPKTSFRSIDSTDGNTYVWINNDFPYPVDRIDMKLSGPRFYKRKVKIYKTDGIKVADLLTATEFDSNKESVIRLMGDKAQMLLAVIENGDNPPLKIDSVNSQSRKRELVAYLEKGKTYYLMGGNETAVNPKYDLVQFRDSIPESLAVLAHGVLVANTGDVGKTNDNKRMWLWPAIIVMIGILGLLTMRLTTEMKKKNI